MTTRCIIICAGEATRWDNYLDVPKHLIEIGGETILQRTVRLLNKYEGLDIFVVGKNDDDRYKIPGSTYYEADLNPENVDADKFLSSQSLWNEDGRTIVFYGDVWFTEEAIDTIIMHTGTDWVLFSNDKECFAQSFYPEHIEEHRNALYRIRDDFKSGVIKRCGGWEHYRAMTGTPLDKHEFRGRNIKIYDLTDDFDFPWEYDEWIVKYNQLYNKPKDKIVYIVDMEYINNKKNSQVKDRINTLLNIYPDNFIIKDVKRGEHISAKEIVNDYNPTVILQEHIAQEFEDQLTGQREVDVKCALILGDFYKTTVDRLSNWDLVLHMFDNEKIDYFKEMCKYTEFKFLPMCVNKYIFHNMNLEKKYDVLVYGNSNEHYPMRTLFREMLSNSNLTVRTVKLEEEIFADKLAKLINESRYVLCTPSKYDYQSLRYYEATACGTNILGSLPSRNKNYDVSTVDWSKMLMEMIR
jgi:hypothetical protein